MGMSSPPVDEEVAAEQAYLEHALASLGAMRQRAERLLHDLVAAGNPDLDYVASLSRRVSLLADSPRPLLFGRVDEEEGPTWHIGRRHVEDARSDPVVVDWRAPVSVPFYRASARDALGLARRRQIMVDRPRGRRRGRRPVRWRQRGGGHHSPPGRNALLAELERARTGEMLDIVATIQAEQDEIIRAPLDLLLTVQGGPGTGKTAVGLHRAAFLLYNHPTLGRDGVLVLGPSRAFLRYIAQVLPSLGEEAVVQTTITDIAPKAKVRLEEPMEVRRIKGDARMGDLLRRALEGRRRTLDKDASLRVRFARATLSADRVNELVSSIAARPGPYKAGRLALRARLVSEARASSVRRHAWAPTKPGSNASSHRATSSPPSSTHCGRRSPRPRSCVSSCPLVPSSNATPPGSCPSRNGSCFCAPGAQRILGGMERRRPGPAGRGHVLDRRPHPLVRTCRRRRGPGPDAHAVPHDHPARPDGIDHRDGRPRPGHGTVGLCRLAGVPRALARDGSRPTRRADPRLPCPGQGARIASRLLAVAAPGISPTASIRPGRTDPVVRTVEPAALADAALAEARTLSGEHTLVAVIAPEELTHVLTRLARRDPEVGILERDGMTRPVTIVPARAAKGLEFDAVVVVEPSSIAGDNRRGLRLLYVAMTRPIQHLSIVCSRPMPEPLLA